MNSTRPSWSNQTKLVIVLALLILFGYLLTRFGAGLIPLILASIVAYVLTPLVNGLQQKTRLPRILVVLVTYILVIGLIGFLLSQVIPPLVMQVKGVIGDIDKIILQIRQGTSLKWVIAGITIDLNWIYSHFNGSIEGLLQPLFGSTFTVVKNVLSSLVWVVFIIVVSIYLIKDSASLAKWFEGLPPPAYHDDYVALRDEIMQIWSSFFRGQLILALIVSLIWTIIGLLIGLRFALVLGVFAGLLEFLPSLGHGIWLVTASAIAWIDGSNWIPVPPFFFMLIVIGLALVFQQFDLNYLIPRIIGRSVHLPPLVVILGIVAGASLAGVLGIMLAAPSIASLRVIGRYIYGNLIGEESPTETIVSPLPRPVLLWWRKPGRSYPKTTE